MASQGPNTIIRTNKTKKSVKAAQHKATDTEKFIPTHYFKAYLDKSSRVKVDFSKKPASPAEFTCLFMGTVEAYATLLLATNSKESVYEHFNNAFGIFLRKLLPEDKIYEVSPKHKARKSETDNILQKPEDPADTTANRLAAYVLTRDVLVNEIGLSEESADLLLNKRLGLVNLSSPE